MVYRKQTEVGDSPVVLKIPMFGSTYVEARMPGYRTLDTELRGVGTMSFVSDFLLLHWAKSFGFRPKAQVELRLMSEHGPVGTWDPDQVP